VKGYEVSMGCEEMWTLRSIAVDCAYVLNLQLKMKITHPRLRKSARNYLKVSSVLVSLSF
jgi:hypothetical protein